MLSILKNQKKLKLRVNTLKPEFCTTRDFELSIQEGEVLTRSNSDNVEVDTLLYLINFGNDEGFAVVGAHESNQGEIYAVTESGSISKEDFDNNGDDQNQNPQRVPSSIEHPNELITSLMMRDVTDDLRDYGLESSFHCEIGNWEEVKKFGPFVRMKLNQGEPYNRYIRKKNKKENYSVGCTGIAMTHIFSANKNPSSIGGLSTRWENLILIDSIDADNNDTLFKWIAAIAKDCKTVYTIFGSASCIEYAQDCFQKYSKYYQNVKIKRKASYENLYPMLSNNKTVFCYGYEPNKVKAHSWVIDGYLKEKKTFKYYNGDILTQEQVKYRELIHCNFGWKGQCDGYYKIGIFDLRDEPIKEEPEDDPPGESGTDTRDRNYKWDIRIITYDLN